MFGFQNTDHSCKTEIHIAKSDLAVSDNAYFLIARTKGEAPFKYRWSNGATGAKIRVVRPGRYCVSVEDANGCISTDCTNLLRNRCETRIHAQRNDSTNVVGSIILTARSFGFGPFSYEWSNGDTTQSIPVDSSGIYCVVVTDSMGCQSRDCFRYRKDNCSAKIQVRRGSAEVDSNIVLWVMPKGRPPFNYLWSNGDTTKHISVPVGGEYCVDVTDALGCTASDCFDTGQLIDSCTAQIKAFRNGLMLAFGRPYVAASYVWSTGDTTRRIKIDSAGEYCVTITNRFGCQATKCIVVDDPIDPRCFVKIQQRNSDHGIHLTAHVRGDRKYSYLWNTGDTTRTIIADSPNLDQYCVTVTNGSCTAEDCAEIKSNGKLSFDSEVGASSYYPPVELNVFPNPFVDQIEVVIPLDTDQKITAEVYRFDGAQMLTRNFDLTAGSNKVNMDLADLSAGLYVVRFTGLDWEQTIKMIKNE